MSDERFDKSRSDAPPHLTPMFCLNLAVCVEGIVDVPADARAALLKKLEDMRDWLEAHQSRATNTQTPPVGTLPERLMQLASRDGVLAIHGLQATLIDAAEALSRSSTSNQREAGLGAVTPTSHSEAGQSGQGVAPAPTLKYDKATRSIPDRRSGKERRRLFSATAQPTKKEGA